MAYYYVSKGETSTGIILNEDYMTVLDGGVAIETTANEYGVLYVWSGGTANSTTVNAGGEFHISSGATANKVKIDSGDLTVYRGGTATEIEWTPCVGSVTVENGAHATFASTYTGVYYGSDGQLIESAPTMDERNLVNGQTLYVMSKGIANRTTINEYGYLHVGSGGTANSTTINPFGYLYVSSGGTASDTTLDEYGSMAVFSGGAANNTVVNSGTFNLFGGVADSVTLNNGGRLIVDDGGAAENVKIKPSDRGALIVSGGGSAQVAEWTPGAGHLKVYADGQVTFASEYSGVYRGNGDLVISSAGEMTDIYMSNNAFEENLYVMNGGRAINTTVDYYSYMAIFSGGTADVVSVGEGATLFVNSGGTANSATMIGRWGSAYVNSGGTANSTTVNRDCSLNVFGLTDSTTVNSGGRFTILKTGKADHTTVNSDGKLEVYGSAENTAISGGSALVLDGKMTGTELTAFGISAGYLDVSSGGSVENTTVNTDCRLFIFKNGTANHTTVNEYGSMKVSGSAENTTISGGEAHISSGGTMTETKVTTGIATTYSGETYTEGGWLTVSKGGIANNTTVDPFCEFGIEGGSADSTTVASGGFIYIYESSTATNITAAEGANVYLNVAPNTNAQGTYAGNAFEMKNGIISGYTVHNTGGKLNIINGGVATDITAVEGGSIDVHNGGVLDGITLTGGKILVDKGGKLTGKMRFNGGAADSIGTYNGAIVDFDLTRIAPGDEVLVNDLAAIKGNGTFTLTVSGSETEGVYSLADGASGFNKTISVVNTSGEELGTLTVGGGTQKIDGVNYSLAISESTLTVKVGGIDPINGPDDGANDWLYEKVTKKGGRGENEALVNMVVAPLTYDSTIVVDEADTVLMPADDTVYHNFVGKTESEEDGVKIDPADYTKIVLATGAKLQFGIDSQIGGKFIIYSYDEVKKKAKALQTTKITVKNGTPVRCLPTGIKLFEAGTYYISMQGTIPKKTNAPDGFYDVWLNDGTHFYLDDDDQKNNWLYEGGKKGRGLNTDVAGDAVAAKEISRAAKGKQIQVDAKKVEHDDTGKYSNFVGFGDTADYVKIHIDTAANLSLTLECDKAAKLTIYQLTCKGEDVVGAKALQTTTLKAGKGEVSSTLKLLQTPGDYYIAVTSTNAKKGDEAYYNVTVNDKSVFFDNCDDHTNDWLYEGGKGGRGENTTLIGSEGITIVDTVMEIRIDKDIPTGEDEWHNFVGFGDDADYRKINIVKDGATASFSVYANDQANFVIYSYDKETNKAKALQTSKLKKENNEYTVTTDEYTFATAGEYYIAVTSTNAKKGGNAYYNVELVSTNVTAADLLGDALSMPEVASGLNLTDDLSFGQYGADALADASASGLAELDDKSNWQNLAKLA